jgi:hypothetical protein
MAAAQHRLGRVAEAGRTAREAMERARAGGYRVADGNTLTTLAAIDLAAGRVAEAAAHAERAIAIQQGPDTASARPRPGGSLATPGTAAVTPMPPPPAGSTRTASSPRSGRPKPPNCRGRRDAGTGDVTLP